MKQDRSFEILVGLLALVIALFVVGVIYTTHQESQDYRYCLEHHAENWCVR